MSRLLDNLLLFGRLLRRAGMPVPSGRLLDLVDALGHVDLGSREEVYHTCRALLVHRQDQIAVFDLAFAAFWRTHGEAPARSASASSHAQQQIEQVALSDASSAADEGDADSLDDDAAPREQQVRTWSDQQALADRDFAAFTPEELAAA